MAEDNFRELATWLLLDLEHNPKQEQSLLIYVALLLGFFNHAASHYPAQGHGKAQECEIDSKLKYYRSQSNHPIRILIDQITPESGRSLLPRNKAFQKLLEGSSLNKTFKEMLANLTEAGRHKKQLANQKSYRPGEKIACTGARQNNLRVCLWALERTMSSKAGGIDTKNLIQFIQERTQKQYPRKFRKIDLGNLSCRIEAMKKWFVDLHQNLDVCSFYPNLGTTMLQSRISRAATVAAVFSDTSKNKLSMLAVSNNKESSCIYIRLYPEIDNDQIDTRIYKKGLTQVLLSFFMGLLNHNLQQQQLHFFTQRRQSFGFLRATLTDAGSMTIRLSLGIETNAYDDVVIATIKQFDVILQKYNFFKRDNELVKECFKICEHHQGKNATEKTGNYLLAAMRSDSDKIVAPLFVQEKLKKATVTNQSDATVFEDFLREFVIARVKKQKEEGKKIGEMILSQGYCVSHDAPLKQNTPSTEYPIILKILHNVLKTITADFAAQASYDKQLQENVIRSYWHCLWKLYKYVDKSLRLLNNYKSYESSYIIARSNNLIENLLEYYLALQALFASSEIVPQEAAKLALKVKKDEISHTRNKMSIPTGNDIDVFYTDNGQQAIILSILAMEAQVFGLKDAKGGLSSANVYAFPNCYFEVNEFFNDIGGIRTYNKKNADIYFIDVMDLALLYQGKKLLLPEGKVPKAIIIDITHNPTLSIPDLKALTKSLLDKQIWLVFVCSCLKHEELGLDKYQLGKVITISPNGKCLNSDVRETLTSVNDEAMHPQLYSFINIMNQIYHEEGKVARSTATPSMATTEFFKPPMPSAISEKVDRVSMKHS